MNWSCSLIFYSQKLLFTLTCNVWFRHLVVGVASCPLYFPNINHNFMQIKAALIWKGCINWKVHWLEWIDKQDSSGMTSHSYFGVLYLLRRSEFFRFLRDIACACSTAKEPFYFHTRILFVKRMAIGWWL